MSDAFQDRENTFEKQFAHDEDLRFKAVARRNKAVALWIAEMKGLSGTDAEKYASEFVGAQIGKSDDDVAAALLALDGHKAEPPANPMSADRVRWEHIQRIYELCGRNVSETARRLNMHRRTLQRILAKRAPR